jgi:nitrogen fixation protein FixH
MKKPRSDCYSSGGLVGLNRVLLLVFGVLFSLSCIAAWAQSGAGSGAMSMPSDAQSTAKNTAMAQATVELTTEPSPPQKGNNTVLVKLASKDGKPIDGAKVTVTFFMAAMPEMGMSAMKTVINASDKGSGSYEGKGDIGSGGSWQVTVKALKGGHLVANKKLTLNVAGGM